LAQKNDRFLAFGYKPPSMNKATTGILLASLALMSFTSKKKAPVASSITALSKKLVFPVSGRKSNVGGFWGDSRDGGSRLHKGIDIFAKKGTPVVAVCDGVISASENGGLGGKALWLKSEGHPWSAYYAHLDRKAVHEGEHVHKGEVLGTVGNTGNARHTPSHLHFGIYKESGAVNPLPYVKHSPKITIAKHNKKHKRKHKQR
jgi:murein DD-endopeptidase MepM/ murein hydrolase activator NlpD